MKKKSKRTRKRKQRTKSKLRVLYDAKLADYRSQIDHALALPATIEAKWESLQGEVVGYRLLLQELFERPRKIDKTLWEDVEQCRTKKGRILRSKFRFWTRIPRLLRRRIRKFESMANEIDELIVFVRKAKKGARFYSKMQEAKTVKKESIAQVGRSISGVRGSLHALIRVLHYLFMREKIGQPIDAGSSVLRLEDALIKWEDELRIIAAHMKDGGISKRSLVRRIDDLRSQLREAPSKAKRVLDLELRMGDLLNLAKAHEMSEKGNVPSDVLVELLRGFEEDIPLAWARGQWEMLERYLMKAKELLVNAEAFLKPGESVDSALVADEVDGSSIRDWAPKRRTGPTAKRPLQPKPPDDEAEDTLLEERLGRYLGEEDASSG